MTENTYHFSFLEAPERIFNCDETGMEYDAISRLLWRIATASKDGGR